MSSEISRNTLFGAIILTAIIVGGIVGGAFYYFGNDNNPENANVVSIYHWWTSGGEKAAIDALVSVFSDQYPDIAVQQTTVSGGAGYNFLSVIKTLVLAGEAPDAFQLHAGYEGQPYYDADVLEAIDYIWTDQLKAAIPDVIEDMMKFGDHYYLVPVNIHRSNVLWYNLDMLTSAGVDPATDLGTMADFLTALEAVKTDCSCQPLSMGETWTAAHLFEQIMASRGIQVYQDWINGEITDATNADLVGALNTFVDLMDYINTDSATLSWDDATGELISGNAAFNIMGDWANGEFSLAGKVYDTDYGTVPVPGTDGMYGLVMDSFQHPKDVAHPQNSDKWLEVVASKAGQDAFNPLKGSIPARNDADLTKYGDYQQGAIQDFKNAVYLFPSVVHGSGAPEAFKVELSNIISQFVTDKNVQSAAQAIVAAVTDNLDYYVKTWNLMST